MSVVAAVPWARHDSRFTVAFEDQCCWLAVNASRKAVAELMRVTWRTVGAICERVATEALADRDLLRAEKVNASEPLMTCRNALGVLCFLDQPSSASGEQAFPEVKSQAVVVRRAGGGLYKAALVEKHSH